MFTEYKKSLSNHLSIMRHSAKNMPTNGINFN